MKVCLINPPWFTNKSGNIWSNIRGIFPSLGLISLAAVLEKEGISVDVIDFFALSLCWKGLEEKIKFLDHDYFGITITTPIANNGYRISRIIKKFHPDSKVIFGGVHATAIPEEPFKEGMADFVVRGDGEETLVKLLGRVPFKDISGLSYKDKDKICHIQPNGLIADLDTLPFPAYHKLNLKLYRPAVGAYKRLPAINMVTTRGCVGKCTFCNSANIRLRRRSAENTLEDIKILSHIYGIKEIAFYDDTFTVYPSSLIKLCDLLIKNKIDITWSCFARTDCVTFEILKKMKAAGCHQVMYGIESASEEVLKNIKKSVHKSAIKDIIDMTRRLGIVVRCTFMFGNPGETEEIIDETIKYSIELDPDIALYNITTPYPGTEMFQWAKKNSYLLTENWDDYNLSDPIMRLPTIEAGILKKKYRQAFVVFYFRPKFILRRLLRINISEVLPFFLGIKAIFIFLWRGILNVSYSQDREGRHNRIVTPRK
jgi:radical SAM superfamily enzyme YgiQ (UPF0313 family)